MSDREILDRERSDAAILTQTLKAAAQAIQRTLQERKEEWLRAQAELRNLLDQSETRELFERRAIQRSLNG